jgi:DNA polymerase III subunit delta
VIYIIYGPDNYSTHQEVEKIKQGLGDPDLLSTNTSYLDGKQITYTQLTTICSAIPFLSAFRLVIVEGLIEKFDIAAASYSSTKSKTKVNIGLKDWQSLDEYTSSMPPTTVLVLLDNIEIKNISKNPLFKQLAQKGKVIPCPQLEGKNLEEWVKRKITNRGGSIEPSAIRLLIEHIVGDLWNMHNSIEMLLNFAAGRTITNNDVLQLTGFVQEASVFDLIDAIINRQNERAQHYLHKLILEGSTPLYIIAMIIRQLRMIVRVKDVSRNLTRLQMMSKLGINKEFILDKTLKQAKQYTQDKLNEAYSRVLDADVAVKTGQYNGDLAIELLVMELCHR